MIAFYIPVDTGRKLNVHKTFRRRPGRLLNVLCTFNLRPGSTVMMATFAFNELRGLSFIFGHEVEIENLFHFRVIFIFYRPTDNSLSHLWNVLIYYIYFHLAFKIFVDFLNR